MPLTKLLSSEARKTTALAISSGLPTRPKGIVLGMALHKFFQLLFTESQEIVTGSRSGTRADHIHSNLAVFEVEYPVAGKRCLRRATLTHGSFGGAIDAEGWGALDGSSGGIQDDGSALWHQRQRLLHGEQ
jgi:hypothetical protein